MQAFTLPDLPAYHRLSGPTSRVGSQRQPLCLLLPSGPRGNTTHPGEGDKDYLQQTPPPTLSPGSGTAVCKDRSSLSPWANLSLALSLSRLPTPPAVPLAEGPARREGLRPRSPLTVESPSGKFLHPIPHSQPRRRPRSSGLQQWLFPRVCAAQGKYGNSPQRLRGPLLPHPQKDGQPPAPLFLSDRGMNRKS